MPSPSELPLTSRSLREFLLLQSDHNWGGEKSTSRTEDDGSITIEFEDGEWKINDNFFVSEDGRHFVGREVVFLHGKPYWYVSYEGWTSSEVDPAEVDTFLKATLRLSNPDFPLRGPQNFSDGHHSYTHTHANGSLSPIDLDRFSTEEFIWRGTFDDENSLVELYNGSFTGGLI